MSTAASSDTARSRVFNFSAGPATLPESVLRQVQDELLCYPGVGASVMEISHRSKTFVGIMEDAEAKIRQLLKIDDRYAVLFLQGGSALQFSMVPANLLRSVGGTAHYLVTGSWSKKAIAEARKEGDVVAAYDSAESNYDHVPSTGDYEVPDDSAMVYYCSNETIQGVQFEREPEVPAGVPLACDASSDFLSRPLDIDRYGLLYACAQKNAGPAGVTVVILRKDLLSRCSAALPGYLNYANHEAAGSMWNTPPTFAVYVLGKIATWLLEEQGGLEQMHGVNQSKAKLLYDAVDASPELYIGHAKKDSRSTMNVTFRFSDDSLQEKFLSEAKTHDLDALKGHRSVGGIRASIYNAMPVEGVETLAQFMKDFAAANG